MSGISSEFKVGLYPVPGIPLIKAEDDIAGLIYRCALADGFSFKDSDIVVVTHKIVSRAENALVRLSDIEPSENARELAAKTGRDPCLWGLYRREPGDTGD